MHQPGSNIPLRIMQYEWRSKMIVKLFKLISLMSISALCMLAGVQSSADDTEIYQAVFNANNTASRPRVLIIFDNSDSMREGRVTEQLVDYDPDITYPFQGFDADKVYWDLRHGTKYFLVNSNRCAESITPLLNTGIYNSVFKTFRKKSWFRTYESWEALESNPTTRDSAYIDCFGDDIENNPSNPGIPVQADGYPRDEINQGPYQNAKTPSFWGVSSNTIYSANYLNYYNDDTGTYTDSSRTYLEVAKTVVTDMVASNTSIDFGLMVFNNNSGATLYPRWNNPAHHNGGRVIRHLQANMSNLERTNLVQTIDDIETSLYTPLCETTYEAYRYLTGDSVLYGLNRKTSEPEELPARDFNAEYDFDDGSGTTVKKYIAPTSDCAYTYIILMTDGNSTNDNAANYPIRSVIKKLCSGNCLDELTEHMANNDLDGDPNNGNQYAKTYTIGFNVDLQILRDAADKGDGIYSTADNSAELARSFQGAISTILSTDATFTSPAVAADTFDRTESRNEVFFGMFTPSKEADWRGNIKRLNAVTENGHVVLKDANGDNAFELCPDNDAGDFTECISDDAQTVWSTTRDGDIVDQGGVGTLLVSRVTDRVLYSNTGAANALDDLDDTYANRAVSGYQNDNQLFQAFGVTDQTELTTMLNWARGDDVDDEYPNSLKREWILADMLHSKPVVVNYGARGSATQANPDQRIVVGTNGGFLHMFDVDDGHENWAFFPKELSSILQLRRANAHSADHVYGIDATPAIYMNDLNKDGTIDSTASEQAIVYFGLRRGGRGMYALDISDPDSPSLKWQIDETSSNFSELGQTWSVPEVTTIPGYVYDHDNDGNTADIPNPVLIFGAGYDTNKDASGVGTADSMGRGIFIVDALDGSLVWSITPAANSNTNMQHTGLTDSVPSDVSVIDSNGDSISDRIYFGDTGGNLWRVDMPGLTNNARPDSSQDSWFITKLADVNGGTVATDRRFFSAPDVVRTKHRACTDYDNSANKCNIVSTINYDAVLIGTGDRSNPTATDVNNQFYMIRDKRLQPYTEAPQSVSECNSTPLAGQPPLPYDFRCELNDGAGLTASDLYDTTANLIQDGTVNQKAAASAALESAHGWRISLLGSGEKSLSRSLTLSGSVFFTTFEPHSNNRLSCKPKAGTGYLYRVNLHDATDVPNPQSPGTYYDRVTELGSLITDTPSPFFGSDKNIDLIFPSSGGPQSLDSDATMPQPYGVYWYKEEQ